MCSLDRRRERYLLIYVRKIINSLVPNIGENGVTIKSHIRKELLCLVHDIDNRVPGSVSTKRRNFFYL